MTDWKLDTLLGGSAVVVGLAILWSLMGLAAFIYSLICIGKTPSITRAIVGVVLAVLFGPLYFIFWFFDRDYCRGTKAF